MLFFFDRKKFRIIVNAKSNNEENESSTIRFSRKI